MARNKEFDHEPRTEHEISDGWLNTDAVRNDSSPTKLGLGGEPDPMRHLDDQYTPKHQTGSKTSSQKDI